MNEYKYNYNLKKEKNGNIIMNNIINGRIIVIFNYYINIISLEKYLIILKK